MSKSSTNTFSQSIIDPPAATALTFGYVKIILTPTQIKNLFTTPIVLVQAPGVGKVTILKEVDCQMIYQGTAYATQNTFNIKQSTTNLGSNTGILFAVSDRLLQIGVATQIPLFENTAITVSCTSNPTLGNSPITLYISWQEITL